MYACLMCRHIQVCTYLPYICNYVVAVYDKTLRVHYYCIKYAENIAVRTPVCVPIFIETCT